MANMTAEPKYPFYGHDRGLDITQPESGKFVERPMTFAELAARDAALEISRDIYRHANYAGSCYHEIWQIIAKAAARAVDEELRFLGKRTDAAFTPTEVAQILCDNSPKCDDDCAHAVSDQP